MYEFTDEDWSLDWTVFIGAAHRDYFGYSVSLSPDGGTVAIGAPYNDDNGSSSGQVRVYRLGSTPEQLGHYIHGKSDWDNFGCSVSLSVKGTTTTVAIGAKRNDDNGLDSGHVRVYTLRIGSWDQLGGDIVGKKAGDKSGESVSLSEDGRTVAIGAPYSDDGGTERGRVSVHTLHEDNWVQLGEDILGEITYDHSGSSVSLSADGRTVAIGAPDSDENGPGSGHVRVYTRNAVNWVQIDSDMIGDGTGDRSGNAVSLSSDGMTVAIGSPYDYSVGGYVKVYHLYEARPPPPPHSTKPPCPHQPHVSPPQSPHAPPDRPIQFSSGYWAQVGGRIEGYTANDASGHAVSVSSDGNIVAIGAIHNDDRGDKSGHVRVFIGGETAWSQLGNTIYGLNEDDRTGWAVSLSSSGTTVAIGAPTGDDGPSLVASEGVLVCTNLLTESGLPTSCYLLDQLKMIILDTVYPFLPTEEPWRSVPPTTMTMEVAAD